MAAQSAKSETFLDCLGARLDQRPCPILYVGPNKQFLVDQFEPRLMALLDEAQTLKDKVARGKRSKKTLKRVAGVPVRLAHAGSSSALKSDPFGLALVDEYDEMLANIKGQGDPLGLVEARGDTYVDFVAAVISTPSIGHVETEVDPVSGLEFWKVADQADLESGIWRLWQEGTRHHWAWPCPQCGDYFIPRFKCLRWPESSTPAEAARSAVLECPHCGCPIGDEHKAEMNARGVYVAPGQRVDPDGTVVGPEPVNSTASYWVSGLCSPFQSFGQRAERFLKAKESGEPDKIQTAFNAAFGECYRDIGGGDAPTWEQVRERAQPYQCGQVPQEVLCVTAGVDVQKRSLYYVIRGWGPRAQSWLLDYGQLHGPTAEDDVWGQLWDALQSDYDGLGVRMAFIDSGFRPDKAESGDAHRVYQFCRAHPQICRATKGHDTQTTPLIARQIEITVRGQRAKSSIQLIHVDSDFFKSLIHSRVHQPDGKPDAWYLPEDVTEEYCRQITSEARSLAANGKAVWVRQSKQNHLLDCEALAAAAGYFLRVQNLREGMQRPRPEGAPSALQPVQREQQTKRPAQIQRNDGWLGNHNGWLGR